MALGAGYPKAKAVCCWAVMEAKEGYPKAKAVSCAMTARWPLAMSFSLLRTKLL